MALYARKKRADILLEALHRLQRQTPISAISPGSVARSFTEAITEQLGDFYDALDFNLAQSVLSTSSGRALDLLGVLYNVQRRQLSDQAVIDSKIGQFMFYIDAPYTQNIVIPIGTKVFTGVDSFIGRQITFLTVEQAIIEAGRNKVFASIKPQSGDQTFTAAPNTLVVHNAVSPAGVRIRCTNPKAIAPQAGYETDDNYRIRISKAIRVASSGTAEAVRFAALNVNGIRDVRIRQAPYGMGTFEALIIPDHIDLTQGVFLSAKNAMDSVRPIGVRMVLRQPTLTSFDIEAALVLGSGFADPNLVDLVSVGVFRYINSLLPGDPFVYNKLLQVIMDTSNAIIDVRVTKYSPGGQEIVRRNYVPKEDEQVVPGKITINIAN